MGLFRKKTLDERLNKALDEIEELTSKRVADKVRKLIFGTK